MLKCKELRQQIYEDFYQSRLVQKSVKLLDNIPKTRKTTKSKSEIIKHDFNKESCHGWFGENVTFYIKRSDKGSEKRGGVL